MERLEDRVVLSTSGGLSEFLSTLDTADFAKPDQVMHELQSRVGRHGGVGRFDQATLRKAIDLNPHPDIFETVLVAFQRDIDLGTGQKTTVMTYNGTTPGPAIDMELGDTLIVHFFNLLPEMTTVHWHGL